MKNMKMVFALFFMAVVLSAGVFATVTRELPEIVKISDINNNELFEIVEKIQTDNTAAKKDIYDASYGFWSLESGTVSDNLGIDWLTQTLPPFTPDDKTYNDGYRLGLVGFRQAFLDANGEEIIFVPGGIPKELSPYMNSTAYSGKAWYFYEKQHYNCGYIHIAKAMSRDFAYTALYSTEENIFYYFPVVYTLREDYGPYERYHMSAFDNDGNAVLYKTKVWPGQSSYLDSVAYKIKLKNHPIVTVKYNGEKIGFDQIPVIDNGRTLVPLRAIFEKIGAEVTWDGNTRTVTAVKGDTTVSLVIDGTTAKVNGKEVTLDVPAKIIGGRTMVPVRFVSDCFGVKVDWNSSERCVYLDANK